MKTDDLYKITEALNKGKIILYPTDTIWGLGCDATNESAVAKLLSLKVRDNSKSQVCLVGNDAMLNQIINEVPALAWDLFDESEEPLTLVLPDSKGLAKNVIADDNSVAVRMIKKGNLQKLLQKFRKPLVSTSANISGEPFPTNFNEISEEIIEGVDLIADLGTENMTQKPSSIIKLQLNGEISILRK